MGRPRKIIGLPEPPTWQEMAAEVTEDSPWTFGQDTTSCPAYSYVLGETGMGVVNHNEIWPAGVPDKIRINRHQRPSSKIKLIYRYQTRYCKDCNARFRPTGPVDRRCADCKALYQEAYHIKHNADTQRRRLAKKPGNQLDI